MNSRRFSVPTFASLTFAIIAGCGGAEAPESATVSDTPAAPSPASEVAAEPTEAEQEVPSEDDSEGWFAGPITNDAEAVAAARGAFESVTGSGGTWTLRNRDGSESELSSGRLNQLTRLLAMDDEGIFYHHNVECADLSAQLRHPNTFLADASLHGAFLYGALDDVPASGSCRAVQVDAGFDGVVFGFQPSDGKLLFIYHSPEDDTAEG